MRELQENLEGDNCVDLTYIHLSSYFPNYIVVLFFPFLKEKHLKCEAQHMKFLSEMKSELWGKSSNLQPSFRYMLTYHLSPKLKPIENLTKKRVNDTHTGESTCFRECLRLKMELINLETKSTHTSEIPFKSSKYFGP